MAKRAATDQTVRGFLAAVFPDAPELALLVFDEEHVLKTATDLLRGRQQAEQARDGHRELRKLVEVVTASFYRGVDGKSQPTGKYGWPMRIDKMEEIAELAARYVWAIRDEEVTSRTDREAALTQALKDYGQHKTSCAKWGFEFREGSYLNDVIACTCGFDAAITGAQK